MAFEDLDDDDLDPEEPTAPAQGALTGGKWEPSPEGETWVPNAKPASGALTAASQPGFSIDDEIRAASARMGTSRASLTSQMEAELTAAGSRREQIQRGIDALMAQKPDRTALMFALSAGFLKPSVTGNFFENIGNAGANAAPIAADIETRRNARTKAIMEGQLGLVGVDQDIAKIRGSYAGKQYDTESDLYSGLLTIKQQQQAQNEQNRRADLSARSVQEVNLTPEQAAKLGAPPGIAKVQVDGAGNILKYIGAGVTTLDKSGREGMLPTILQRYEDADLNDIDTAKRIEKDLGIYTDLINRGELNLGMAANFWSNFQNFTGWSSQNSRNYAMLKNSLSALRNDSLRLNAGVQTEGDAQRAWSELMGNINDEAYVKERLEYIAKKNAEAAILKQQQIDRRRANSNTPPLFGGAPPPRAPGTPAGASASWDLPPGVTVTERK